MSYGDSKIGTPWRGYYITAYGIAVKHGFKGTEEEWLASLQGADGRSIEIRYNDVTNVLEWKFTDDDAWTQLLDLEQLQTEIVAQTLAQAQAAQQAAEAAQVAAEAAQQEAERNAGVTQADASITQANVQLSQDAKTAAEAAKAAAETAQQVAEAAQAAAETAETGAEESATLSKSWAVGGTGTRPGEDTNNAEYWAGQAAAAAGGGVISFNGRTGTVLPELGDYNPRLVGAMPNKTYIINGYFIGGGTAGKFPINQRGKTSYGLETRVLAFDGWAVGISGQVTLEDDGIVPTIGTSEYGFATLEQIIEDKNPLVGQTVTLSAATDEDIYSISGIVSTNAEAMRVNIGKGLDVRTYLYDDKLYVQFVVLPDSNVKVKAVKLEIGNHQTLGWKDNDGVHLFETPDYGETLERCQRYLLDITPNIQFNDSFIGECGKNFASFCIPTPVTMRAVPVFIGDPTKIQISASNGAFPSPTEVRVVSYGENFVNIRCVVTEGDLNAGMTCNLRVKEAGAKLLLSAEL